MAYDASMDRSRSGVMRIVQLNAENLFLYMDHWSGQNLAKMSEKQWQKLSASTVLNKPLLKVQKLAKAVLDIDPDILMLNEVGGLESLENFSKYFLNDLYKAYLIEGNSDRGIDVGYLIKRSLPYRYLLNSHKSRPLDFLYPHEETSNSYFQKVNPAKVIQSHYFSRDVAELRVHLPENDQPVLIILLTHLKSKLDPDGIDPQGRERRAAELNTLLDIYNEIEQEFDGKVPIAVAGDFNGLASRVACEPEMEIIYERTDLEAIFDILERPQTERATQIQIPRGGLAILNEIDYIFVSPSLRTHLVPEECYVYRFKSELGVELPLPKSLPEKLLLPSDHYPVVAGIRAYWEDETVDAADRS